MTLLFYCFIRVRERISHPPQPSISTTQWQAINTGFSVRFVLKNDGAQRHRADIVSAPAYRACPQVRECGEILLSNCGLYRRSFPEACFIVAHLSCALGAQQTVHETGMLSPHRWSACSLTSWFGSRPIFFLFSADAFPFLPSRLDSCPTWIKANEKHTTHTKSSHLLPIWTLLPFFSMPSALGLNQRQGLTA